MPFIGVRGDRPVLPLEVADDGFVWCPSCEAKMKVREGEEVARHFYHVPVDSECGGESAAHVEMKHIAAQKLLERYPDAGVSPEHSMVDGQRRADIRVLFAEPDSQLGRGIAVEVQRHHRQKSVRAVTEDYLSAGFSVLWLSEVDYDGTHPGYDDVTLTDPVPVWPYAVPQLIEEQSRPGEAGDWSVQMSERELAPFVENGQMGQRTLGAFAESAGTGQADVTAPGWSLERTISLALTPESKTVQDLTAEIFRDLIPDLERERDVIQTVEDYRESTGSSDRNCYVNEWFAGGPRDPCTIELIVTPDGEPVELSVEKRRTDNALSVSVEQDIVDVFTDLVATVCTELAVVSALEPQTSDGTAVWSHEFAQRGRPVNCTITRTHGEWVELSLHRSKTEYQPVETILVRLLPADIEMLLELCARVRLHVDTGAE